MSATNPVRIPDLARAHFKADPYPLYARLRSEAPVCRTRFLGRRAWLITRYDDVLMVLREERIVKDWPPVTHWIHFVSRPVTRHMLNRDDSDHVRLRKLAHHVFHTALVEQLHDRIQRICDELLDNLEGRYKVDLIRDFALPLPLTVMGELVGIAKADRGVFHKRSRTSLSAATIADVLRAVPDQKLLAFQIRELIKNRRRNPKDDLVTALVKAEEGGDRLTEDELVATIFFLLLAGYETTVSLIGAGALALMQHPHERERFVLDSSINESAIEELLRYTSPLDVATQRFAREDIKIRSVPIARGNALFAVLGSANRDETQFPDPNTLNLGRTPNKHVALGQGVHFCLGAPLARLNGQIALTSLFRRFSKLRLAEPQSLRWRKSLFIRGLETLPVCLDGD